MKIKNLNAQRYKLINSAFKITRSSFIYDYLDIRLFRTYYIKLLINFLQIKFL